MIIFIIKFFISITFIYIILLFFYFFNIDFFYSFNFYISNMIYILLVYIIKSDLLGLKPPSGSLYNIHIAIIILFYNWITLNLIIIFNLDFLCISFLCITHFNISNNIYILFIYIVKIKKICKLLNL